VIKSRKETRMNLVPADVWSGNAKVRVHLKHVDTANKSLLKWIFKLPPIRMRSSPIYNTAGEIL